MKVGVYKYQCPRGRDSKDSKMGREGTNKNGGEERGLAAQKENEEQKNLRRDTVGGEKRGIDVR